MIPRRDAGRRESRSTSIVYPETYEGMIVRMQYRLDRGLEVVERLS